MSEDKLSNFQYTYSAPTEKERKEIESIKQEYQQKTAETSKLDNLRALDKKAKNVPKIISISLGTVATLIFGCGMSIVLVWESWIWGGLVSAVGILGIIAVYPFYIMLCKMSKNKYGAEIIRLSEELLNEEKTSKDFDCLI